MLPLCSLLPTSVCTRTDLNQGHVKHATIECWSYDKLVEEEELALFIVRKPAALDVPLQVRFPSARVRRCG
jgi:hypothetical protein